VQQGDPEIGEALVENPRVPVERYRIDGHGARPLAAYHGRLDRAILELGGNNGMIVAPSADLDLGTRCSPRSVPRVSAYTMLFGPPAPRAVWMDW
jgi:acyl-CoA reductase-like NAD-dependent aldehyde dehydrogenase